MSLEEENNKLIEQFVERTFYKAWRNPDTEELENFRSLELFLTSECDLKCKYCYLNRYGNKLYPPSHRKNKEILENLDVFMDWLVENEFQPEIELFSGEIFSQDLGFEAVNLILDKLEGVKKKPRRILIPTNFTFLTEKDRTKKVENILQRAKDMECPIHLSASVDGKYCEENRPFANKEKVRDDDYYERVFSFAKKWRSGFHPMIYSELIEEWKDNFLWFQKMFKKYDLPWNGIYLLEIRNEEWTSEQMVEFKKFIEFLIEWTYKTIFKGKDRKGMVDFIFDSGYNILSSPLSRIGRGIGCSIQGDITVRVGDLSVVPCHRTSYEPFKLFEFKKKNGNISGIEAKNPAMTFQIYSHEAKNQPYCESCSIKNLCSFGCFGSQYESLGELFTPIPTVCQLELMKMIGLISGLKKINVFKKVLTRTNDDIARDLKKVEKIMDSGDLKNILNN